MVFLLQFHAFLQYALFQVLFVETAKRQIGLYGGSFNPVHLAHLQAAQTAVEEQGLDRLIFVPAAQSPFKSRGEMAEDSDRIRMLRTALAGRPDFGLDEREIKRGGVSYSIDTVKYYRDRYPDAALNYLIGSDQIATLLKWRNVKELAELVYMLVIPRPGSEVQELPHSFRGHRLKGTLSDISSSVIRDRIRRNRPINHLVGSNIAELIDRYRLYST
jgi:nicotinate-nucleotide adenylyltransferase